MGTITTRRRRDGPIGFTAQIRLKRKAKVIYTQAQTIARAAATALLKKREADL